MKAKTKALLDQVGATKVKFYEIVEPRIPFIGPILTVCLLLDENANILSRGISIKSIMDTYDYRNGKDRAFKRALTAGFKKSDGLEILAEHPGWKKYCKKVLKVTDVEETKKQIMDYYDLMHSEGYSDIPGYVIKEVAKCRDGSIKNIAIIYIPRAYPLTLAVFEEDFRYKSSYKPEMTEFEKDFIQKEVIDKQKV